MITVITPLHQPGNKYIEQTYASLQRQTNQNWSWLILENHGGTVPSRVTDDSRVTVYRDNELNGIGQLKLSLSLRAQTEFILELDADDLLDPTAIEAVMGAFDGGADFVYSDHADFLDEDGKWTAAWRDYPYGSAYGWAHYPVTHCLGEQLIAMRAPPVTPHNIRYVEWSPNHVRAWRKSAYQAVGGHNPKMEVGDDHDLIVRFYLAGKKFAHIPYCLYFYRVHANNTVGTGATGDKNQAIRAATNVVYNRSIWKLAESFADDSKLKLVDLCCWKNCPPGYEGLDNNVDGKLSIDLNGRWPLADNSVGVLRARDAVEHLRDPIHTMNEAYRVLAPGGFFMIDVPSTNGQGAFCDPTHVSFWNKLSFRYYTQQRFADFIPAFKGRFQNLRTQEWFPDDWHKQHNVPYVESHLVALKPGYKPYGEVLW